MKLTSEEMKALRELTRERGTKAAAAALGMHDSTLLRLLAAQQARAGSVALARQGLAALASDATERASCG